MFDTTVLVAVLLSGVGDKNLKKNRKGEEIAVCEIAAVGQSRRRE